MHTTRNKLILYGATLAAGLASLGLHRYMMANCFDDKGLLIAGNLPGRLLLLVGVVFALTLLLMLHRLGGDGEYADNFHRDLTSGLLMIFAGAAMALAVPGLDRSAPSAAAPITVLTGVWERFSGGCMTALPWLAAVSMAVLGLCRMLGKRGWFGFGGVICLFYMLMLVGNYRLWSADPQLQDYAYQLLAGVLLMLCSFHRTCCDAGIIQRKKLLFTGLAAAFCAITALSMDFQRGFYLASALWALGCLGTMAQLPPDPEEEPEADTAEKTEEG